jgi:hypothetical protein
MGSGIHVVGSYNDQQATGQMKNLKQVSSNKLNQSSTVPQVP